MPQSLSDVALHIIFSTKDRRRFLQDTEVRQRLFAYIAGVLKGVKCYSIEINGVEDHIHVLCNLSRTISIAELVEQIKKTSSAWIKQQGDEYRVFYWQNGYGAFSVSRSLVPKVREYIVRQEERHQKLSFQDEFRALCRHHGVEIDERYVWD